MFSGFCDIHVYRRGSGMRRLSWQPLRRGSPPGQSNRSKENDMIARIASLLALLAILIPAAALAQPEDQRSGKDSRGADSLQVIAPAVEIDFCQLRPRYEVYFTKADFTATFSFEVGADGAPKNFVDRTHITREDALRWGWPEKFVGP